MPKNNSQARKDERRMAAKAREQTSEYCPFHGGLHNGYGYSRTENGMFFCEDTIAGSRDQAEFRPMYTGGA